MVCLHWRQTHEKLIDIHAVLKTTGHMPSVDVVISTEKLYANRTVDSKMVRCANFVSIVPYTGEINV